jgi:hypothetical protein
MNDTRRNDNLENPKEEPKASLVPVPKVAAAGIAGAITVVLVFIGSLLWPEVEIPEPVTVAITVIITFLAGYLKS